MSAERCNQNHGAQAQQLVLLPVHSRANLVMAALLSSLCVRLGLSESLAQRATNGSVSTNRSLLLD